MHNNRASVLRDSAIKTEISLETEEFLNYFDINSIEDPSQKTIGVELEAWIVDENHAPIPVNKDLIKLANNHNLVEEILKFNLEYNSPIFNIEGDFLSRMHQDLEMLWKDLNEKAATANCSVIRIGTLPTLKKSDIREENISTNPRYSLLNENIMREMNSSSFDFNIKGPAGELKMKCDDILIEGSTTSLQIHTNLTKSIMPYYFDALMHGFKLPCSS